MTRTTVYHGPSWDHDGTNLDVLADVFHNHDNPTPVVIKTSGGQEIHLPEDEGIDIYIDGEPVDQED